MRISKILINHMTEPIGFQLDDLQLSLRWKQNSSQKLRSN